MDWYYLRGEGEGGVAGLHCGPEGKMKYGENWNRNNKVVGMWMMKRVMSSYVEISIRGFPSEAN